MLSIDDQVATSLPAYGIAQDLNYALSRSSAVIVTAPPGTGKSTLLPLTLLQGLQSSGGRILMLEPRRLAARQIAERMASLIGERPGQTVGYRVRFETCISKQTRIEVLTEGILTRMLISDPTLEGVDVVIFDEFHERSINADEALALARDCQRLVRPDLKLVIMSATIDTTTICKAMGGAPLISCEGSMYPVEIIHTDREATPDNVSELVAHYIRLAHKEYQGDILAFLPGEGEIRKTVELLGSVLGQTRILPLYGMLSSAEQREAIAPSPELSRKVVLSTPIAETSITIEGVRIVVDGGLYKHMEYQPQTALSALVTSRISIDMADQRAGRAGRVAPGVCYRLWSLATESRMAPTRTPEIDSADLSPMVLDVALWDGSPLEQLPWLSAPPGSHVSKARGLLQLLGALDEEGHATGHGRDLATLPCHPRIAQMLLQSHSRSLAADIAAVLEERDPMPGEDSDLTLRISTLRSMRSTGSIKRGWGHIKAIADQYLSIARAREDNSVADGYEIGRIVALAYPERVAHAVKDGVSRYQLASGEMACVDASDTMSSYEWLAVASVSSRPGGVGRIFLAAPVDPDSLTEIIRERDLVVWSSREGGVVSRHERRIGALLLDSKPLHSVQREEIFRVIAEAASKQYASMFDWSDEEVQGLQRRVQIVASWHPELDLPDVSTQAIALRAGQWLPVFGPQESTISELKKIDMKAVLWSMLSYEQQQSVERLAPSHITVPSGSSIRLQYRQGSDLPVLRVRLQECFGMRSTPRVDGGRRTVLMELLSPGYKPVQITTDLESFWRSTYYEVRSELARRYPKHAWPDDPLGATAVRGVKRNQ